MLALALALQLTAAVNLPTVLVFTSTECPISNRYAPEINRLNVKFAGKVQFVMVYPAPSDTDAKVRAHVEKFAYPNQWLRDPAQKLVKQTGVTVMPEVAVMSVARKVLYRGRIDDRYLEFGKDRPEPTVRDLERALEAVVAGKPVPRSETRAIGCFIADLVK